MLSSHPSVHYVPSTVLDFLYAPSFHVARNILDFSGMGVIVVPEVPRADPEPSSDFTVRLCLSSPAQEFSEKKAFLPQRRPQVPATQ